MASGKAKVQCRLVAPARWLLICAAVFAKLGIRIPHPWVAAVVNRSWRMRIGDGRWRAIRIDNAGRIIG